MLTIAVWTCLSFFLFYFKLKNVERLFLQPFSFQESQTVADILQRRFARYGDESGTKTIRRKEAATAKMKKYLLALGDILG